HDPNENVRGIAVSALGMLRARQTVPELIRLADDPSDYVRQGLAESLGMLCAAADKPARPAHPMPDGRPTAHSWFARLFLRARARRLRQVDPVPLAVIALRHGLRDPSPVVRTVAAQSLGRLGPGAAAAAAELIAAL